jgi:dTDP-glucose pyrophosphorylase
MKNWKQNTIRDNSTVRQALAVLNNIGIASNVLFVLNADGRLLGSVTDGDIRRGLLRDSSVHDPVVEIMNANTRVLLKNQIDNKQVGAIRSLGIVHVPVVDENGLVVDIINLREFKEIVPVHAVIMAGGKGQRLMPLTKDIPKPLLKVGSKPIIEHNIDRLIQFGVKHIHISINYKGEMIREYFGNGSGKGIDIQYICEEKPLGTIGSMALVDRFEKDELLLLNSDLLTNIDFSDFYKLFSSTGAAMGVATVPHHVDLPYAIMELDENRVVALQEKPRYTYFANAGIYLIKTDLLKYILKGHFFNATDLMEKVIQKNEKLISYPILGYWLDIGRMNDYVKAQEDIQHLRF